MAAAEMLDAHYPGDGSQPQEPQFVPRDRSADEGDGYVLVVVGRPAEMRSDLLVLDAQDIAGEPVATLALPFRLRYGLHGNWVDAQDLAGAKSRNERAERQR